MENESNNQSNENNNTTDVVAQRRRALAEALRNNEGVVVTPSGEVEFKEEADSEGLASISVPDGKLAFKEA